jgi:hypothetical protein
VTAEAFHAAGFDIEATYGTWMRTPFDDTCPLIILIARAL